MQDSIESGKKLCCDAVQGLCSMNCDEGLSTSTK